MVLNFTEVVLIGVAMAAFVGRKQVREVFKHTSVAVNRFMKEASKLDAGGSGSVSGGAAKSITDHSVHAKDAASKAAAATAASTPASARAARRSRRKEK